jgi:RNA polymerase sigma-70 factor (ECF subfamily)
MSFPELAFGASSDRIPYAEMLAFSDEQLIKEVQAGNTDAFAVIFKRYHRLLHLVALRVLRDAGEAEDLTQTVFLEIYRKLGQFDVARGSLKGWLLLLVQRRSINRRNYLLVRQFHNQVELRSVDEEIGLWSPRQVPVQETNRVTNEALSVLPAAQRQTIEMYFFEGLSLKEIAHRREETFSNVRHHYYRGLERLRFYLVKGIRRETENPSVVPSGEV